MPDDADCEGRLREVLRDQGWSLRPRPDAQARVRRAARRQRVKAAGLATCAGTIAAAAVAVSLALSGGGVQGTPVAGRQPSTPSAGQRSAVRSMPAVTGLQLRAAETVIRSVVPRADIVVRHEKAQVPAGTIIAQFPAPGERLASGSRVTLVASSAG
jgi:PASTA domain